MSVEWGEALDFTVCNKQNHIIWMQVASREGGHHSACGTNSRSPWRFGSHGIAIFKNGFAPWVCMPCKGEKVNSFGIATEIKASIFFKVWLFLHTELGVCVLTLRLFVYTYGLECCRETSAIWVSVDVPATQAPGLYIGEICITAVRPDTEYDSLFVFKRLDIGFWHLDMLWMTWV